MYKFKAENYAYLHSSNITLRELTPYEMSQSKRVIQLPQVRLLGHNKPSSSNTSKSKPRDPEVKKNDEAAVKAQIKKELKELSKRCLNNTFECALPVLQGREYCSRHITQDPTAPFKQCSYSYNNGERCRSAANANPSDKRDHSLCFDHARLALLARQRNTAPAPPVVTTETLLNQLQHHVKAERVRTTSCASSVSVVSEPVEQELLPRSVDPFKQIDASAINSNFTASVLECCSESDSDGDVCTLGRIGDVRNDCDKYSGDEAEFNDGNPLAHAGIYTAEEAVSEARNSLKNLQSAYTRQMNRLRLLLQTARLQYIRNLRGEKEQFCNINTQARTGALTIKERKQLKKLKAYASYHKKHGVDAVLSRKLCKRRAKVNDNHNRPVPSQGRCIFTEGGVRCMTQIVPSSKYCMKHILLDRHQILFRACGDLRGAVACKEPIANLPLIEVCKYHTNPPPYTTFGLKKENSDCDSVTNTASDVSRCDEYEQVDSIIYDTVVTDGIVQYD